LGIKQASIIATVKYRYGKMLIQFDLISTKGVQWCSDERSIVGRRRFDVFQPTDGLCRFV
jgi:hypothetical protein